MNIAEFIFASIKKSLPNINWSLGSVLRELIATPFITVAEKANDALIQQSNALSINDYVENPEKYEAEINRLFNSLGLASNSQVPATGTATVFTNSNNPTPIYKNTIFYYEDMALSVSSDVYPGFVSDGTTQGYSQIKEIGYKSYCFDVPLVSTNLNVFLAEDTPLSWGEAPEDVYNIVLTSPMSGGRTNMTLKEKALKIKDYVAPNTITLNEGIAKLLRSVLPDKLIDAQFAQDTTAANKSYLYIKTKKAPGTFTKTVTGRRTKDGQYEVQATIPGIIDVYDVFKGSSKVNIYQLQITNNNLYCLLEYDSEDLTLSFDLQLYGLSDAEEIQQAIDGYLIGTPYRIEVKAPDVFSVDVEFSYTGATLNTIDLNNICEYIQNLLLNQTISDSSLSTLLTSYGSSLKGPGVYTIYNHKGSCYKQQVAPFIYAKNLGCFAIYTGITNIEANYV